MSLWRHRPVVAIDFSRVRVLFRKRSEIYSRLCGTVLMPVLSQPADDDHGRQRQDEAGDDFVDAAQAEKVFVPAGGYPDDDGHGADRSEEHTSELQSRGHLVCRLLLEKKNDAR